MILYEKGIVKGYGATGEFRHENKLTREHAAKMITLAAKDNAIRGFPDGTFRPKDNIRRGHAAKMAALAFGLKEG